MPTITVHYFCKQCGIDKQACTFRERFANEDVALYTQAVAFHVGEDHRIRSPYCRCNEVDLIVPYTSRGIGYLEPPASTDAKDAP